jgi:hypothetical protein
MNSEYEKDLEGQIDRLLKRLPELRAPESLAAHVMTALHQKQCLAWHRKPWQSWPLPLRVLSLAILLGSFGGLCFTAWHLTRAAGFTTAVQEVGNLFSGVIGLWNALNTLLAALFLIVKQLGIGFIVGALLALGIVYAAFFGLGTIYLRLAFARN